MGRWIPKCTSLCISVLGLPETAFYFSHSLGHWKYKIKLLAGFVSPEASLLGFNPQNFNSKWGGNSNNLQGQEVGQVS